jgi:hypothetical protein
MSHLLVGLASTYASPTFSIKHAVFSRSVVFFLDVCSYSRRTVLAFKNHPFITFAAPRAYPPRCIVFCFYCAVGVVFSGLLVGCTSCFLSSHVAATMCCPPMLARFFRRCLYPPHCITFFPFTLRRASHFKPLNINYSPSPSLFHCKIYTPHRSYNTHGSFST